MPRPGDFAHDVYSQNGEDGIIAEILRRLAIDNGYFVEVGAWDGIRLSSCRNLYDKEWSGCCIEGHPQRFRDLETSTPEKRISKLCVYVRPTGKNSLDAALNSVEAPRDVGLLSIDIDADDHAVWQGLTEHTAKIVVIEFNPTIPNACKFVQPEGAHIGNSAGALVDLASEKGYALVAATACNLIFVRRDLAGKAGIEPQELNDLRKEPGFLFHAYDGRVIATGGMSVNPWTRRKMKGASPNKRSPLHRTRRSISKRLGGRHIASAPRR